MTRIREEEVSSKADDSNFDNTAAAGLDYLGRHSGQTFRLTTDEYGNSQSA